MTTVATDGRSMAADGQVTSNRDYVVSLVETKVQRLDNKIIGCCGGSGCDEPFIKWLRYGGDQPELDDNFCALVIDAIAPPRIYWHDYTSNVIDVPYAIGSGAPFALAAMDLGKSPADAVAYASTRDVYTGGAITELFIQTNLKAAA